MRRLAWVLAALLSAAEAHAQALTLGGDPRVDPNDFRVTVFASGLDFPLSMAELSDGSLLVGLNHESFPGASLLNSDGELVRLVDADDDGIADGPGQVLASGLDAVTSVELAGNLVFVATGAIGSPKLVVLRQGATPSDPFSVLASLDLTLPLPWSHLTLGLTARAAPGSPGVYEVFFTLGSRDDAVATTDLVPAAGLWTGNLQADAIHRLTLDDTGPGLVATGLDKIGSGLRNTFGHAFDPATGDLYLQDNGINGPSGSLSVDELNVIAAAEVGGTVEDFGFPSTYVEYGTGTVVGSIGILPLVTFQPLPSGGAESKGAAELAFAPPLFPAGLADGLFVAFHGNDTAGTSNTGNPLVYVDLGTLEYFHFVAGGDAAFGHLDSLLASADSLYAADLTNVDGVQSYGTGSIYRIQVLAGPCEDGLDNDGDGATDLADPGCRDADSLTESPQCQDGINNDPGGNAGEDDFIDFDGGLSALGYAATAPDPQCKDKPWRDCEWPSCCGLGFELALLLPGLMWLRRRRQR